MQLDDFGGALALELNKVGHTSIAHFVHRQEDVSGAMDIKLCPPICAGGQRHIRKPSFIKRHVCCANRHTVVGSDNANG